MSQYVEIQNGIVVVTGPSAVGKSVMAQQIFESTPYHNKVLLQQDNPYKGITATEKVELLRLEQQFLSSTMSMSDEYSKSYLRSHEARSYVMATEYRLQKALEKRQFVVLDGTYCQKEILYCFLAALPKLGLMKPVTLLRLCPDIKLHMSFYRARKRKVEKQILFEQMREFHKFSRKEVVTLFPWVRVYEIGDPRKVKFDFLGSNEVTVELLSAYSAYEDSHAE